MGLCNNMPDENQNRELSSKQYKKSCTLAVPGLLNFPDEDRGVNCEKQFQLKEMELFFARARQQSNDFESKEEVLFDLFGLGSFSKQGRPIAPVCYIADADSVADSLAENKAMEWCLRADPVCLTPDRDELVLSGPEVLSLAMPEAEHLVSELNVLFKEDGWRLEAVTATRWYLHLPVDPLIITSDLSQARGQSINNFLPGGPKGKEWHRVMNEVQMVLHASEVNIERQGYGQLPVSSLWFWGGGKLPEPGHSCWSQVWSNEVLSRGLAKVTRTPCFSAPEDSNSWLSQVNTPGEHLIVCDDFNFVKPEQQQDDLDAWCSALQKFESNWLIPLMGALRKGELDELTLNPCDGRVFNLTRSRLNYWWHWRKPIRSYFR